jgi:adenosylcobinamide-phosphate synthase
MEILVAIAIGFILDLMLGDPYWLPHPIRFIGNLIAFLEKMFRKYFCKTNKSEYICGIVTSFFVVSISFILPYYILLALSKINIYLKIIVEAFFCYQILATKSLKTESMKVYKYLKNGDIINSRKYLSYIVGRDTANLSDKQITKATVETISENTSDGVIAPLIFMAIGGAPLAFLYKAVNTLDSMIGYKNERYLYFGRFAAKLDDILNFIPAIISAYFMIFASFILRLNYKNAIKIYKRDKYNHSSPNSAKTESVCAGALDVLLAGDANYFGKQVKKKTIGDDNREIMPKDICIANKLMLTTAIIAVFVLLIIRFLVVNLF